MENCFIGITRPFQKMAWLLFIVFLSGTTLAAEPDKARLTVDLDYHALSDSNRFVEITVYEITPEGRVPRGDVLCNLFLTEISREGMMGGTITGSDGKAFYPLVNKFRAADDTISLYAFITRIVNDERFFPLNDTTIIRKSEMNVEYLESADQAEIITEINEITGSGKRSPVTGLVVRHYVRKHGELIPISEKGVLTDANGRSFFVFPDNVDGDSNGNVELVTRLESPVYGTLESSKVVNWAIPSAYDDESGHTTGQSNLNVIFIVLLLIIPTIALFAALAFVLDNLFAKFGFVKS